MKILIADDDISVRKSLCKVLEEADYEVLEAADGHETLEQFEKAEVDLLLLDIDLPVKSGWDAFEIVTNKNPALPIIIVAGQVDQYKTAPMAGVGVLMEKPLDASQLLQTMQELLAEPKEARLRRLCDYNRDTRHVPSSSAIFLRQFREQHSTPLYDTHLTGLRQW